MTEVEAYEGESDPGSRACRGRTARNASTSGPSRHAYVHFVSGTSRQSAWMSISSPSLPKKSPPSCSGVSSPARPPGEP
ncbi:DNA-3-methyladenine glycosylase [Streptomyces sp. NPDC091682]|uniref:DNA-3-methyladenine glycosylase n=1 Tax=Streptomyces sp. NPDC091682 TaxID=3366005 RepID=UPI003808622F